jgi:hypothetical protein
MPRLLPAALAGLAGLGLVAACSSSEPDAPPPKVTEQPAGGNLIVSCDSGTDAKAGGTVTLYDSVVGITRTGILNANMSPKQVCDAIRAVAGQAQLTAVSEGDGTKIHITGGGTTLYVLGAKITVSPAATGA